MNRYHRWYCRSDRWARALQSTVLPWVIRDYELGASVLEIGPGPGLVTDSLRQRVVVAEHAGRIRCATE